VENSPRAGAIPVLIKIAVSQQPLVPALGDRFIKRVNKNSSAGFLTLPCASGLPIPKNSDTFLEEHLLHRMMKRDYSGGSVPGLHGIPLRPEFEYQFNIREQ